MGCSSPASSWTARSWPTSPCAIPRRSPDSLRPPARRRPPERLSDSRQKLQRAPHRGARFFARTPMITSPHNEKLKELRKLAKRREGRFVAEGEDLLDAADAAGWEPVER